MKRLFLSLSLAALVGICAAAPACAQDDPADVFEKELEAFQKKSAAPAARPAPAQPAAAAAPAAPVLPGLVAAPANPLAAAAAAARAQTAAPAANPLGPAAELPLGKQPPATANALGLSLGGDETPEQAEARLAAERKKIEDLTFDSAIRDLMPMTPEQIRKLLDAFRESRQASETPIAEPKPRIAVQTVSLDPDQPPPVISTSPGRVTTLIILDASGAPWPIQDVSWAGKFTVTPPEEGGHVVRITPDSAHNMGNLSIRLVDLITPITFTLRTGLEEVDYRFDARIPRNGPLAKAPLIENGGIKTTVGGDENLVQILDGTPPGGSEKLTVDGADGRSAAWRLSGKVYLRTPLTLLSPAWNASVSSADGMNVYVLDEAPVLLLSDEGRMVRASIASTEGSP